MPVHKLPLPESLLTAHTIKLTEVRALPIKSPSSTVSVTPASSLSHLFVRDNKAWYSVQHKIWLYVHTDLNKK
jgi:hypothetical protein